MTSLFSRKSRLQIIIVYLGTQWNMFYKVLVNSYYEYKRVEGLFEVRVKN